MSDTPNQYETEITPLIENALKKSHIPGLAVGILEKGALVYFHGFGSGKLGQSSPITPDTVFRLASISKIFTAIALMQLWEKGKFELDDPVNKYLPNGKILKKSPAWPDVTFRHLLTHQSGIGELPRWSDLFRKGFGMNVMWPNPVPPLSVLHAKSITPQIPAAVKYAYSNFGVSLLGYLIEILSGEEYVSYMRHHILDPLGMSRSDFIRSERVQPFEAEGYVYRSGGWKSAKYFVNIIKPAGALYSTINDLSKFAEMLLKEGKGPNGPIIRKQTLQLCWTPQYFAHPSFKTNYAIGILFWLYEAEGLKIIEHTGITTGFTSALSLIPNQDRAIMVFSNLDETIKVDSTLKIKNFIIKYFLGTQTKKKISDILPLQSEVSENFRSLQEYSGIYGGFPGVLTNTRILLNGGDFKVSLKNHQLEISAIYGSFKHKLLSPTNIPDVFDYEPEEGALIAKKGQIAFLRDDQQHVIGFARGFLKLRKNPWWQSLRAHLVMSICIVGLVIIFLTMLS